MLFFFQLLVSGLVGDLCTSLAISKIFPSVFAYDNFTKERGIYHSGADAVELNISGLRCSGDVTSQTCRIESTILRNSCSATGKVDCFYTESSHA